MFIGIHMSFGYRQRLQQLLVQLLLRRRLLARQDIAHLGAFRVQVLRGRLAPAQLMEFGLLVQHVQDVDQANGEAVLEQRDLGQVLFVDLQLLLDPVVNVVHDERRCDEVEGPEVMVMRVAQERLESLQEELKQEVPIASKQHIIGQQIPLHTLK